MKQLILVVALLFASAGILSASTPADQDLLIKSKQQSDIFRDQVEPFQLEVDFRARFAKDAAGHLTWKWRAKDRWWRRIVMEGFEQIEIRNGEMLYTKRNISFTPVRIRELVELLVFPDERLVAKKQKQRVEDGTDLTCIQSEVGAFKRTQHEVCLNSASHDIVSDTWQWLSDVQRQAKYSEYFEFAGYRYPRKLEMRVNGNTVITASVQALTTAAFDEALLTVPQGAIERRLCANPNPPVPLSTPDPPLNRLKGRDHRTASLATVSMTVLADGSVSDIHLVSTTTRPVADIIVETLKTWRFKPGTCGHDPIPFDVQLELDLR